MNIKFKHVYEEHAKEDNIKEYIDTLPPGSVFYDLGANLGWFSLYAVSKGLRVYAFEADENNFRGLKENVEANPHISYMFDINLYNIAIADKQQVVKLRMSNLEIGGHLKTLDLPMFSTNDNVISNNYVKEIGADSLDNIIKQNNLPYPDHLKVDIDGSEYAFLIGSPNVLDNAKSMVIELYNQSKYYNDSVDILHKHGFKLQKEYLIPDAPNLINYIYTK